MMELKIFDELTLVNRRVDTEITHTLFNRAVTDLTHNIIDIQYLQCCCQSLGSIMQLVGMPVRLDYVAEGCPRMGLETLQWLSETFFDKCRESYSRDEIRLIVLEHEMTAMESFHARKLFLSCGGSACMEAMHYEIEYHLQYAEAVKLDVRTGP